MKKFKKFTAAVAATLMAATMVAPMAMNSFAAATPNSITVKAPANVGATHKYTAYQIFTGTATGDTTITLNGVQWAGTADGLKAFITALKGESCPISDDCAELTENSTAAEVAKLIETNVNADNVKAFAKFLETQLDNFKKVGAGSSETITLESDVTDSDGNVTSTPGDGWYLVIDDTSAELSPNGAYSSYLLENVDASKGAELNFKGDAPSIVKKVEENVKTVDDNGDITDGYWASEDSYNDVADYSFGDAVSFRLEATLPSSEYYNDYEHYYLNFEDNLGAGFDAPTSLTVTMGSKTPIVLSADNDWKDEATGLTANITGNTVITVELMDAKKTGVELAAGETVTVDYDAVLNVDAVVGRPGNYNDVDLEYSNNPKNTGNGESKPDDTDKTEKDGVVVFTYGFDVHKYDGADADKALLAGAKFAVKNSDGKYMCETEEDGKTIVTWEASTTGDNDEEVYPENMKIWESDTDNNIVINGLDDGTYSLVETESPKGYNPANPIEFTVVAKTKNSQNENDICPVGETAQDRTGKQLEALKINYIKDNDGTYTDANPSHVFASEGVDEKNAEMLVENNSGAELPSTGGIGTTLFYLGGGAMVAVAGVFLITKKRMKKEEL